MVTRLLTMLGFGRQVGGRGKDPMVTYGYAVFYACEKVSGVSRVSRKWTILGTHLAVDGQNRTFDSHRLVESAACFVCSKLERA